MLAFNVKQGGGGTQKPLVSRGMEKQFAIRQQIGNLRLYDGMYLSLLEIQRQNVSGSGSAPLFRKHNINGTPGATGYRLFRALSVFMDLLPSIFTLVDLSFFRPFERIHKVMWEYAYHWFQ